MSKAIFRVNRICISLLKTSESIFPAHYANTERQK